MDRLQRRRARSDLIGQRGKAEINAFLGVALGLAAQWLIFAELINSIVAIRFGPAILAASHGGCRGWLIFSQSPQVNSRGLVDENPVFGNPSTRHPQRWLV